MATEAVAVARDEGWLARLRRNRVLRRLRQHKLFLTGFALFAVVLVMAVFAPLIAPLPPDEIQFRHRFEPPSLAFPMGTDNFGRDLLSRVVYGARLSLEIGFTVVLLTGIFGTA
ncbi:MAG: ABC transporter permease, partial [Geminicoccaceae bacterium]|nr:ABC transporter permease [Geminicoccaceae bacterium]